MLPQTIRMRIMMQSGGKFSGSGHGLGVDGKDNIYIGGSGGGGLETLAPLSALRGPSPEGLPAATTFTVTFTASKLPAQQHTPEGDK